MLMNNILIQLFINSFISFPVELTGRKQKHIS